MSYLGTSFEMREGYEAPRASRPGTDLNLHQQIQVIGTVAACDKPESLSW